MSGLIKLFWLCTYVQVIMCSFLKTTNLWNLFPISPPSSCALESDATLVETLQKHMTQAYNLQDTEQDSRCLVQLRRWMDTNGFHMTLHTHVRFSKEECLEGVLGNLDVHVLDVLPASTYIDVYEINELKNHTGYTSLISSCDVNIEAMNYTSRELVVKNTIALSSSDVKGKNVIELDFLCPLHARYHLPTINEEYIEFTIGPPLIVLVLSSASLEVEGGEKEIQTVILPHTKAIPKASFLKTSRIESRDNYEKVEGETETLTIRGTVPVGMLQHDDLVCVGTLIVACSGVLVLVLASMYSPT